MSLASLLKKGSLRGLATAKPATFAIHSPFSPSTVATVATLAVAKAPNTAANDPVNDSVSDPNPDSDRWCWPNSTAMTGAEIDTFTARRARFTDKGLSLEDGEALSNKLVKRDRETDHQRLCLECANLAGRGVGSWSCKNWQSADVSIRAKDARLPHDLVHQLQCCAGFSEATK